MTSTPVSNSSSLGICPVEARRSISIVGMTLIAAGASTMRSAWRDAETTVIVSAKGTTAIRSV